MRKLNQNGAASVWLILSVLMTLLFFGALGFGVWAYTGREELSNNIDQKVAEGIDDIKGQIEAAKDKEFVEKEKQPLKLYKGPAAFGTVGVEYPKTWSAFVTEASNNSGTPVDGYFHPSFVPGINSGANFALRIEVVETAYVQELAKFESMVKNGTVKVSPYAAPKVPRTTGARVEGEIIQKKKGTMVLLPLRDKTLKVWTEADQFQKDYVDIILANLTFVP